MQSYDSDTITATIRMIPLRSMVLAVVARFRVLLSSSSRASLVDSLEEAAVGAVTSSTSNGAHNRDFSCQQYGVCCREGSWSKGSRSQWIFYSYMLSPFLVLKNTLLLPTNILPCPFHRRV